MVDIRRTRSARSWSDSRASILRELPKLQGHCDDRGRLAGIRRSANVTLNLLNTISYSLGEPIP